MKVNKQYLDPHTPASQVYGLMLHSTNPNNKNLHTHNYCEIMLIIGGRMFHKYDGGSDILSEKQLCFVRAEDIHSCSCYQGPCDFFNIGIPSNLLQSAVKYYDIDLTTMLSSQKPPIVSLSTSSYNSLHQKIQHFMKTDYSDLHGRMFKNLLSEMLFLFTSPANASIHTLYQYNTPKWFLEMLAEMDIVENFTVGLPKLLQLSEHSQEYINRCFKKYLNTTPTQYINSLRLNHAKKLILEDNTSIIEACYRSGFNSESYFYKEFKEMFHSTPLQLIESQKKVI